MRPAYDTPFYNLEAVGKYAATGEEPSDTSGFMSLEEALQNAEECGDVFEDVKIEPGKVFVEIVTLDSEGCAPCQYMCEAVKNVAPHYGDKLTWRESLIKSAAGIKRTQLSRLHAADAPHQQRGSIRQHHADRRSSD